MRASIDGTSARIVYVFVKRVKRKIKIKITVPGAASRAFLFRMRNSENN